MKQILFRALVILVFVNSAYAGGFVQYYVALKSKETNLRAGPNVRYPIRLKIARKNEPLKVINKFQNWRQVEDSEGDKGWAHVSNLSSKKFVKTKGKTQTNIHNKPEVGSDIIAKTESNVVFSVLSCKENWCKIERDGIKGWIEKTNLWGAIDE